MTQSQSSVTLNLYATIINELMSFFFFQVSSVMIDPNFNAKKPENELQVT